jgi:succinate dehydrogenase / fumarate reductase cytochrome b subunit
VAGWVIALASGPDGFNTYRALLGSPLGVLVMFGLTVAFLYHLANGVRHLVWDLGKGFDPKTADMTGWAAIAFGVVAAVLIWIIVLLNMGAGQ